MYYFVMLSAIVLLLIKLKEKRKVYFQYMKNDLCVQLFQTF